MSMAAALERVGLITKEQLDLEEKILPLVKEKRLLSKQIKIGDVKVKDAKLRISILNSKIKKYNDELKAL